MKKVVYLCAMFSMVSMMLSEGARAEEPSPYLNNYCYGLNWGCSSAANAFIGPPPFFAIFPPVYYRANFAARDSGRGHTHSSSYDSRPVEELPQPMVVVNPFVKSAARSTSTASYQGPTPQVVLNPYVSHGSGQDLAGPLPQVVFPGRLPAGGK